MVVWPFMPVGDITETLEWRTDVLQTKSGEQRIQLRAAPRREWMFKHVFNPQQHMGVESVLRAGQGEYLVPDWTQSLYIGPVSGGASVSVALDTTGADLVAGGWLLLMANLDDYQACQIESVSPAAVVLVSATAMSGATIWRAELGRTDAGIEYDRPAGRSLFSRVQFKTQGAVDCSASGYTQYRGHDVMTDLPVVGGTSLTGSVVWPVDVIDYETGVTEVFTDRNYVASTLTMRWHAFTAAAKRALRQWIFSRAGRLNAFWIGMQDADIVPAADIGASATVLRVFAPYGAESFGISDFDIEINGAALYRRRVTGVAVAATLEGKRTLNLTLDASLGVAHTVAQISKISRLRCVRFDADRVEFLHAPRAGMVVAMPCIEVPVP